MLRGRRHGPRVQIPQSQPNVLLEWRRTILYSPLKRQNQSINTYRKTPGFPWSDVHADADWQNMKSVIVKFDFSPNQFH